MPLICYCHSGTTPSSHATDMLLSQRHNTIITCHWYATVTAAQHRHHMPLICYCHSGTTPSSHATDMLLSQRHNTIITCHWYATVTAAQHHHHMPLICCSKIHYTRLTLVLDHIACLFSTELRTIKQRDDCTFLLHLLTGVLSIVSFTASLLVFTLHSRHISHIFKADFYDFYLSCWYLDFLMLMSRLLCWYLDFLMLMHADFLMLIFKCFNADNWMHMHAKAMISFPHNTCPYYLVMLLCVLLYVQHLPFSMLCFCIICALTVLFKHCSALLS